MNLAKLISIGFITLFELYYRHLVGRGRVVNFIEIFLTVQNKIIL